MEIFGKFLEFIELYIFFHAVSPSTQIYYGSIILVLREFCKGHISKSKFQLIELIQDLQKTKMFEKIGNS